MLQYNGRWSIHSNRCCHDPGPGSFLCQHGLCPGLWLWPWLIPTGYVRMSRWWLWCHQEQLYHQVRLDWWRSWVNEIKGFCDYSVQLRQSDLLYCSFATVSNYLFSSSGSYSLYHQELACFAGDRHRPGPLSVQQGLLHRWQMTIWLYDIWLYVIFSNTGLLLITLFAIGTYFSLNNFIWSKTSLTLWPLGILSCEVYVASMK